MHPEGWQHFGPYSLNLATLELRKDGRPVAIERQPALVLARLVASQGLLVTRRDLKQAVWPDDTHVDFDRGLNYCVRQVRQALGEDARSPKFIETVPRQGYRFTVAMHGQPVDATRRRRWRLPVLMSAAALLTAIVENGPGSEHHHRIAMGVARTLHDWLF